MTPYPLLFRPILKRRVWGGGRLARLNKPVPEGEPIGESWEIADLPSEIKEGQSVVANGPMAGKSLHEAIAAHGNEILGSAACEDRFPLLIKYLDARENLSVQLHPDRAYAERHPEAHLKDEAWIVIDHEPGAVIYKGLRTELDANALREHIASGAIVSDLNAIEVKRGECHYLPSGMIHALGAGVLVAEVQTPSDTTFRMYDWGRTERQLHVDEALEVIFGASVQSPGIAIPGLHAPEPPIVACHIKTTHLLDAERFSIERIEALDDAPLEIITSNLPEVWMILEGSGEIGGDVPVQLTTGTTVLLPAAMPHSQARLRARTQLLRVTLPSPLKGVIA